jgi:hypothetical protein
MWLIILSILICVAKVNSVPISAGMDGLADWSQSHPYVNLVRQARTWGSPQMPWDGSAKFDPKTGWPLEDFGMVLASGSLDLGGKYLFYGKGNAQISFTACSGYTTNQTYDASTNTMTAIINVPEGEQQLLLSFHNTSGPGLTDIALLQPGYNLASKSNITKLTLAHLSRFSILRFMDWTGTNGNLETNWEDTTPVDWPQYASRRNPWATIPFIANSIGKPIDILVNLILDGGIFGSCGDLCGALGNRNNSTKERDACLLVCDAVGLDEFIQLLIKTDLDPIWYCEIAKLCPRG